MTYKELRSLLWNAVAAIEKDFIEEPDRFIRWRYPESGNPDWKSTDDILFLYLAEADDDYAKQRNSQFVTSDGTVKRKTTRTRVWDLQATAYGPDAYELANALKDGFFYESIQNDLAASGAFLVPNLPVCQRAPELFDGRWWDRWDITLRFNEDYQLAAEDVGHIDSLTIKTTANRP